MQTEAAIGVPRLHMEYRADKYLQWLVEDLRVVLIGWTKDVPCPFLKPHRLEADELAALMPFLRSGQIQFVRIEEHHATTIVKEWERLVGEGTLLAPKERKEREVPGGRAFRVNPRTRGKRASGPPKSKIMISDSDDEAAESWMRAHDAEVEDVEQFTEPGQDVQSEESEIEQYSD